MALHPALGGAGPRWERWEQALPARVQPQAREKQLSPGTRKHSLKSSLCYVQLTNAAVLGEITARFTAKWCCGPSKNKLPALGSCQPELLQAWPCRQQ